MRYADFRRPRPEANSLNYHPSPSITSMPNPISLAKPSSSHHSSGAFGTQVSPKPKTHAPPPNRRNAAENPTPPERAITARPCGGETLDVKIKRPAISVFLLSVSPTPNGQMARIARSAGSFSQKSSGGHPKPSARKETN